MATQVQFRGGTTTEHASFTGAAREVTVDTTKDTVVVHDGTTAGGIPLATEADPTFTGTVTIGGTALTSTAAELNYSDGVTSNIQTQLGTKAPIDAATFTGSTTLARITAGTATTTGFYTINAITNSSAGVGWSAIYATNKTAGGRVFGALNAGATLETISMYENGDATFGGDVSIADKIVHTGDTNAAIRFPSADTVTVETAGSERLRIDSSGRMLLGTSTSRATGAGSSYPASLQIESSGFTNTSFTQNSNDIYGPEVNLGKSRGTSAGGTTVIQDDDQLGIIQFAGADGTDLETNAAAIECCVDGTPGSNDMPGRLVFSTTADGASSPTEAMRITSSGVLLVGLTAAVGEGGTPADLNSTEVGRGFINLSRDDTAAADHILFGKNGSIAASMGTDTTNTLVFKTGTTERMRINSGGDVNITGICTATSFSGDGSALTNAGIIAGKAMGLAAFLL